MLQHGYSLCIASGTSRDICSRDNCWCPVHHGPLLHVLLKYFLILADLDAHVREEADHLDRRTGSASLLGAGAVATGVVVMPVLVLARRESSAAPFEKLR